MLLGFPPPAGARKNAVDDKDGDANVRSVWLCSRNDAVGNAAVMIAALGVWGTAAAWPDLVVAGIMAGVFLTSAVQILRQATTEYREGGHPGEGLQAWIGRKRRSS